MLCLGPDLGQPARLPGRPGTARWLADRTGPSGRRPSPRAAGSEGGSWRRSMNPAEAGVASWCVSEVARAAEQAADLRWRRLSRRHGQRAPSCRRRCRGCAGPGAPTLRASSNNGMDGRSTSRVSHRQAVPDSPEPADRRGTTGRGRRRRRGRWREGRGGILDSPVLPRVPVAERPDAQFERGPAAQRPGPGQQVRHDQNRRAGQEQAKRRGARAGTRS